MTEFSMSIELMTEAVVSPPLAVSWLVSAGLGWLMFLLSVFLILLVLVQRGKGGGLTGALGGPGGQSAFGSKAGDTFTAITAGFAIVWGLVCAVAMYTLGVSPLTEVDDEFQTPEVPAVVEPDAESEAEDAMSGLSGLSGLLSEEAEDANAEDDATDGTMVPKPSDEDGTPSAELNPPESSTPEASPAETPAAETPAAEGSEPPAAAESGATEENTASEDAAAGDTDSAENSPE
jgi:preprotein translocase subunit SecG